MVETETKASTNAEESIENTEDFRPNRVNQLINENPDLLDFIMGKFAQQDEINRKLQQRIARLEEENTQKTIKIENLEQKLRIFSEENIFLQELCLSSILTNTLREFISLIK